MKGNVEKDPFCYFGTICKAFNDFQHYELYYVLFSFLFEIAFSVYGILVCNPTLNNIWKGLVP